MLALKPLRSIVGEIPQVNYEGPMVILGSGRQRKNGNGQDYYFLQAILQGAMDFHSESVLSRGEDGAVSCRFCGELVVESPWKHVSWKCVRIQEQELDGVSKSFDLVAGAKAMLEDDPAFWLRGLPSVELPDPLDAT